MYEQALSHLRKADPVLRKIIRRGGPCKLEPMKNHFAALMDSIVSQQLSVKAAATIYRRFLALYPGRRFPKPADVIATTDEQLRAVGLSRQKLSYIKDLAQKLEHGSIDTRRFQRMSDEEVVDVLTQVKGVGRWTAEMFLIFSLNRLNVLPVDDLGFRKAVKIEYGMSELPEAEQLNKIAQSWHPYCSIATWYLWASLDNVPAAAS
ncbi:MAG TPA: DNA-3-methyladenine glycosylase [bacterium]